MIQTINAVRSQPPDLTSIMAHDPGAVIEDVARQHGTTPREVVAALPSFMRGFAPGSDFVAVMNEISRWGDVTLIVHTDDGIMEFTGPVAAGKVSGDYYNVMARRGFHGHLRYQRCSAIAFVQRPFMGRASAFIAFFNAEGAIMFKVFVGRNERRELLADQLAAFEALASRLCGSDDP